MMVNVHIPWAHFAFQPSHPSYIFHTPSPSICILPSKSPCLCHAIPHRCSPREEHFPCVAWNVFSVHSPCYYFAIVTMVEGGWGGYIGVEAVWMIWGRRTRWVNGENISRNSRGMFLQWRAATRNGVAQTWGFPWKEEVNKVDDDMGRYGRRNKVGKLGGRGGGDDGWNNNKARGNILSIPSLCAFIVLLFETPPTLPLP